MGVAERNVDNFAEPGRDGPEPARAMRAMGNVAQLENGNPLQDNFGRSLAQYLRNRLGGSLPGKDANGKRSRPSRSI